MQKSTVRKICENKKKNKNILQFHSRFSETCRLLYFLTTISDSTIAQAAVRYPGARRPGSGSGGGRGHRHVAQFYDLVLIGGLEGSSFLGLGLLTKVEVATENPTKNDDSANRMSTKIRLKFLDKYD